MTTCRVILFGKLPKNLQNWKAKKLPISKNSDIFLHLMLLLLLMPLFLTLQWEYVLQITDKHLYAVSNTIYIFIFWRKMNRNHHNFGLCLHFQHNLALFFFVQLRLSKQAIECSTRCHVRRDGRAMWVACSPARFPATLPSVFCELKIMKIIIFFTKLYRKSLPTVNYLCW